MHFSLARGLCALCLLSAPAFAQATYLETTCAQSALWEGATTCDRGLTFTLTSDGEATIMGLYLTAPPTHCSRVSYVVAHPPPPPPTEPAIIALPATPLQPVEYGVNYITRTRPLAPGQTELVTLGRGFSAGTHPVMVMVVGLIEDCNIGQIHSWGVTAEQVIIPE